MMTSLAVSKLMVIQSWVLPKQTNRKRLHRFWTVLWFRRRVRRVRRVRDVQILRRWQNSARNGLQPKQNQSRPVKQRRSPMQSSHPQPKSPAPPLQSLLRSEQQIPPELKQQPPSFGTPEPQLPQLPAAATAPVTPACPLPTLVLTYSYLANALNWQALVASIPMTQTTQKPYSPRRPRRPSQQQASSHQQTASSRRQAVGEQSAKPYAPPPQASPHPQASRLPSVAGHDVVPHNHVVVRIAALLGCACVLQTQLPLPCPS